MDEKEHINEIYFTTYLCVADVGPIWYTIYLWHSRQFPKQLKLDVKKISNITSNDNRYICIVLLDIFLASPFLELINLIPTWPTAINKAQLGFQ